MPLPPLSTSRPGPPGGFVANDAPPGPFFQGHRPPFPTCTWWVGFAASPNQNAVAAGPFPFMSQCLDDGIAFGVPTKRDFDGTSVHQPAEIDLSASFSEHGGKITDHRALSWDEQSVTVQYFAPTCSMTSYLVPGAPFMTFEYRNSTPVFRSLRGSFVSINGAVLSETRPVALTAFKFNVTTKDASYIMYSLHGHATLVAQGSTLVATRPFTGVLRIAKLMHHAHEHTLDTYVGTYPTGVSMDFQFEGDVASLIYTWDIVGPSSRFIQLSWPHHRKAMQSPTYLPPSALSYLTIKGWMVPVLGVSWRLVYELPAIDFHAPRPPDESCLEEIIRGLEYEVAALGSSSEPGDFYFWGGAIAAVSRLALIAEHLGRGDLIAGVVDYLKASLRCWTEASYTRVQAAYETNWGAVISKAGATNHHVDFGNGFMNDHHFHYGYILCAGATIAKFDPTWLEEHNSTYTNGEFLSWFVRDIANPSPEDTFFPVVRHRDWFAGHSWASGIANGAGDRDQESLTEAINGYYGCLLYATVTKNEPLRNFSRLLIATEQAAAIYWHLNPAGREDDIDEPYPEQGLRDLVTIGNVMQWQAGAWLFWGSQRAQIAAIQILPVTPINEAYYSARWTRDMLRYVQHELADPSIGDEWKSVIYLAYANHDPHRAMELSQALTSWGSGNSYSNQLYFIATRPNPSGRPIWPRGASAGFPQGTFALRCVATGKYVSSRAGRPELVADADIRAQAAGFTTAFAPGGVTLRHALTNQFVTADISGEHALSAAREKVAAWEVFKLIHVAGRETEEASSIIQAGSNKRYIGVSESGALMPCGEALSTSTRFVLTQPPEAKNPLGEYTMQDAASGMWVTCAGVGARLIASASTAEDASRFRWTGTGPDGMSFSCSATGQFITADPHGGSPLAAARDVALAWEHFWVDADEEEAHEDGCFTIRALVNECFVVTNAERGLVNSASQSRDAGRYRFLAAS